MNLCIECIYLATDKDAPDFRDRHMCTHPDIGKVKAHRFGPVTGNPDGRPWCSAWVLRDASLRAPVCNGEPPYFQPRNPGKPTTPDASRRREATLNLIAQPDARKIDAHAIVRRYLEAIGADGLCNAEAECGCHRDFLAPCECGTTPACYPARRHTLGPDEYIGDACPGETIYVTLGEST